MDDHSTVTAAPRGSPSFLAFLPSCICLLHPDIKNVHRERLHLPEHDWRYLGLAKMTNEKDDVFDPFDKMFSVDEDVTSPGARRTAFGQNPHGTHRLSLDAETSSNDSFTGILTLGKPSECQIVRNEQIVRKGGSRVRVEESQALRFAHSLQLPAPTDHRVTTSDAETEIVMDFIEGECLEEAWPPMNPEQKQSVAEQLRDIVTVMRSAPLDQRRFGVFDGPTRDCRQFSDYFGGQFESEVEFNAFVLDLLRGTPLAIRRALGDALSACSDHRIVFTHGDLTSRDIIVKEGRIQALLDWEYAGWYPEFWEFVKFFDRPTDCKDWRDYAEVIFEVVFPRALLTFQALARWQKP